MATSFQVGSSERRSRWKVQISVSSVTASLPEMTSLVIADTSLARAEALAREAGDARVGAAQIDVAVGAVGGHPLWVAGLVTVGSALTALPVPGAAPAAAVAPPSDRSLAGLLLGTR